jgi:hypothetical protein
MFGRAINNFEDYRSDVKITPLSNRIKEIKHLVENDLSEAISTIKKKQIGQKRQQDARNNPTDSELQPGQTVTIKSMAKGGKLQRKYVGTFKIVRRAKGGNYILENEQGQKFRESLPLSRLKLITNDNKDDQYFDIEKILDARKKRNKFEYLVKWANHDESENSWEPEENFTSTEPIENCSLII